MITLIAGTNREIGLEAKLRSAYRPESDRRVRPLRSSHRRWFRVDNPHESARTKLETTMSIRVHQYACMPHGCDYSTTVQGWDWGGRKVGQRIARNWRGGEENIWTSMSLPYRVTNVGRFTNPIMPNATDDAACLWIITAICIRTGSRTRWTCVCRA